VKIFSCPPLVNININVTDDNLPFCQISLDLNRKEQPGSKVKGLAMMRMRQDHRVLAKAGNIVALQLA
jgi:hypothetical protein